MIGGVIGALVSRIAPLRAAVGSLITGLQTLPSIAWFPFAIILFGISTTTILFVIVLGAAPSIANGLIAGVDYTPPLLLAGGQDDGAAQALAVPVPDPACLAARVRGRAEAGLGVRLAQPDGRRTAGRSSRTSRPWACCCRPTRTRPTWRALTSIIIVILILGIIVDMLFGVADRAIRRRWGLTGAV